MTASIGVGKSKTEDETVDYILRVMACLDVRILSTVEKNIAALKEHTNMPEEGDSSLVWFTMIKVFVHRSRLICGFS